MTLYYFMVIVRESEPKFLAGSSTNAIAFALPGLKAPFTVTLAFCCLLLHVAFLSTVSPDVGDWLTCTSKAPTVFPDMSGEHLYVIWTLTALPTNVAVLAIVMWGRGVRVAA